MDLFNQLFDIPEWYSSQLRVYPIKTRNPELEYGDKIILPEDALRTINFTNAQYPLMFKIFHEKNSTYCSVKEFTAEHDMCYIPTWIMRKINAFPGDMIQIKNINIRKAAFVRFCFRDPTFNDLSNPRAILENKLKAFSVVARRDRIHIEHLGKEYLIDIADCSPDVVVDIVDTDVEVDITYKGVKPPILPPTPSEIAKEESPAEFMAESPVVTTPASEKNRPQSKFVKDRDYFEGRGHSLKSSSEKKLPSYWKREDVSSKSSGNRIESRFDEENKKKYFCGKGHRLN